MEYDGYRTEQRRFLEKPICHHMCKHVWIMQWGVEQGSFIWGCGRKMRWQCKYVSAFQQSMLTWWSIYVISTWMFPNSHCSHAAANFRGITPETDRFIVAMPRKGNPMLNLSRNASMMLLRMGIPLIVLLVTTLLRYVSEESSALQC